MVDHFELVSLSLRRRPREDLEPCGKILLLQSLDDKESDRNILMGSGCWGDHAICTEELYITMSFLDVISGRILEYYYHYGGCCEPR